MCLINNALFSSDLINKDRIKCLDIARACCDTDPADNLRSLDFMASFCEAFILLGAHMPSLACKN